MEELLLTHAEVALGLAGFAAIVAAFQRPLAPMQRFSFLAILSMARPRLLYNKALQRTINS